MLGEILRRHAFALGVQQHDMSAFRQPRGPAMRAFVRAMRALVSRALAMVQFFDIDGGETDIAAHLQGRGPDIPSHNAPFRGAAEAEPIANIQRRMSA